MVLPRWTIVLLIAGTYLGQLVNGAKIYQSRRNVLKLLGAVSREIPLFITGCEMNNNAKACRLAIDNDTSSEWSQCASTNPETDNRTYAFWRGYLQTPAYITTVYIQNADWANIGETDALLDFTISGNGENCYSHLSDKPFESKAFPCDILADDIEIKANLATGNVLAICEVQVFGVPINFPTELGEPSRVTFSECEMSSVTRHCYLAYDTKLEWVEKYEEATCAESLKQTYLNQWWKATFEIPAIVQYVTLFNRKDKPAEMAQMNNFDVNIGKRRCGRLNNAEGFDRIEFPCNLFGGDIEVQQLNKGRILTLCEVEIVGHLLQLRSEQKRKLVGCFLDNPDNPDLGPHPNSVTYMSVNKCDRICRREKKKYMGLQSGMECWCGDSYGKHGSSEGSGEQNSTSSCSMPCEGAKRETCGGLNSNHIYELIYNV